MARVCCPATVVQSLHLDSSFLSLSSHYILVTLSIFVLTCIVLYLYYKLHAVLVFLVFVLFVGC